MRKSRSLTVAIEAAKKAEKAIMRYYSAEIKSELKPDQTPVTIADKEAEKIIIKTIKSHFPNHGFLGEESGVEATKSKYLWIIDPIDGTKNYIRKIPIFATQIALMKDGKLTLGVSNAPALKELMYAEKNKGAFLNDKPIHVSQVDKISEAMICHGGLSYFKEKGILSNICSLINDSYRERGFGDFYMYHLLASGRADVAVEAAIKIWDVAALSVIVEEAGGLMTDIKGNLVDKNVGSIVATNKKLHQSALKYF